MYSDFAYVYDKLMYDIDYIKWADYIEKIFSMSSFKPSLILDLGCGTGSLCIEMDKRGYEMIGVDSSIDMLNCAKNKSLQRDILYINQDMTNFELYGTVDVVLSLMDSINYLLYRKDIKKVFLLVKNYLNPGGFFIFDVNTPFKFKHIFGDNVFYDVSEHVSYIWQNNYDNEKEICEFDLTFFIKDGEHYKRYDEIHHERCYQIEDLKSMVMESGLELLGVYDELKFALPSKKSQRVFFICRKGKL
ncbi:MAG: class I SAM-dependent methyltransferase [Clostridium sp.]|nr:class I SAM-dependent methyltransferase [Clostridium sp.]